jgi:predicted esterase
MSRSFPPSAAALLAAVASSASAATSVTLPDWVCAHPDAIYNARFDGGDAAVPLDPSNGSGGAFPGKQTRTLHIAGLGSGTQNYYLYLPPDYTPTHSWPLLLVLHGVATVGDDYAIQTRDSWATAAQLRHFIVAAPVADQVLQCWTGTQYVGCQTWLVNLNHRPNDYDLFDAIRADLEAAYNIERTRVYGWGFSAGAHVMHDLALTTHSTAFNASTMAAYAVSAGALQGLTCQGASNAGCAPLLDALPRRIPLDIHIGTSDPNLAAARADHALFDAHGWLDGATLHYTEFSGGHIYTGPQPFEMWANLCPNAVVP